MERTTSGFAAAMAILFFVNAAFATSVTLDFEGVPDETIVNDDYQHLGVQISSATFDFGTYDTTPVYDGALVHHRWPTSGQRSIRPATDGIYHPPQSGWRQPALILDFVSPGTTTPSPTDSVSLFTDSAPLDNSVDEDVVLVGYDSNGNVLAQDIVSDDPPNNFLSISSAGIYRAAIAHDNSNFGTENFDEISFTEPAAQVVPSPSAALAGGGLMLILAAGSLIRRRDTEK